MHEAMRDFRDLTPSLMGAARRLRVTAAHHSPMRGLDAPCFAAGSRPHTTFQAHGPLTEPGSLLALERGTRWVREAATWHDHFLTRVVGDFRR